MMMKRRTQKGLLLVIVLVTTRRNMKFEHEGHPQDTLTLQLIPASFRCDACNVTDEGLFYRCDSCDFWIHKTCASLAPTADLPHHHHEQPLLLIYSLHVIVANFVTNTFDGWMHGCIIVETEYILPILYVPRMRSNNLLLQEMIQAILMLVKAKQFAAFSAVTRIDRSMDVHSLSTNIVLNYPENYNINFTQTLPLT
ncbi:C1-like protein [Tanacetum coccineum]